ncbi:hypothetical protein PNA2_1500 [Pyrococcus sp. NA2]|nr:DUF835 domain-containing protein [Pyrococcus sp. NA2]AEC52415.1 hypothetical protein PNA2_1500 [Pyrococcus sp. NA2]
MLGPTSYETMKFGAELIAFASITIVSYLVFSMRRFLANSFGRKVSNYTVLGVLIFWSGYLVNLLNEIVQTHFMKVLDDVLVATGSFIFVISAFQLVKGLPLSAKPGKVKIIGSSIPSGAYYVTGLAIEELLRMLSGKRVLAITRNPAIWENLGIPYIWLSNIHTPNSIEPTKLAPLLHHVLANSDRETFVVLDNIDYILLYNGPEATLKFLLALKDNLLSKNGGLIVFADPRSLPSQVFGVIEREFLPL